MAQKTLKQLAEDRGVGHVAPVATDALLAQTVGGQPKWFEIDELEITTGQIGDDQVNDSKLAHGSANSLRGFDAAGAPATITAGSGILISGSQISSTGGGGSPSGGGNISIANEGVEILASAAQINLVGAGVNATDGGGNVAVLTISGGANVASNVSVALGGSPQTTVLTKNQNNIINVATLGTHVATGDTWDNDYDITFIGTPPDGLWFIISNTSGFTQTLASGGSPAVLDSSAENFELPTGYAILLIRDQVSGQLVKMGVSPLSALGALASLDTVDTAQLEDAAVTAGKLANTAVTPQSFTTDGNIITGTVDAQGRWTALTVTPTGGGAGFTGFDIQATTTGTSLSPTGTGKQYELSNATSCAVLLTTGMTDEGETVIHALASPSGNYTIAVDTGLTLNGAAAPGTVTISKFIGAKVFIKRSGTNFQVDGDLVVNRNFGGSEIVNAIINASLLTAASVTLAKLENMAQATVMLRASGAGTGAPIHGSATQLRDIIGDASDGVRGLIPTAGGLAGAQLFGIRAKVNTSVSGSLTTATHSNALNVTSGNCTIPNAAGDVGFNATFKFGGAHTLTFNGLTSPAFATGDIASVLVQSTTVIITVKTPAANLITFS